MKQYKMDVLSDKTRVQWVKKQLQSLPEGGSILDVGAGEQRYKRYCAHLKYVSQDFGQYKPGKVVAGLHPKRWDTSAVDIVSDIRSIPVKSNSFDNILCTEVLEHVSHPDLVIKELSRILKNRGRLILTAPFCAQTHFAPHFYHTGFSTYWYGKTFKRYNLKIMKLSPNGNFFDYMVQELLRLPLVIKRYSSFGWTSLSLYVFIFPLVALLIFISKLTKGSEQQLCFGWHLVAKKINDAKS